jgi:hypothetical protein
VIDPIAEALDLLHSRVQWNKKQVNLFPPCYPADREEEILSAGLQ